MARVRNFEGGQARPAPVWLRCAYSLTRARGPQMTPRAQVDVVIRLFLTTATGEQQTAKDYESSALTN
jgi:hypothetical protein